MQPTLQSVNRFVLSRTSRLWVRSDFYRCWNSPVPNSPISNWVIRHPVKFIAGNLIAGFGTYAWLSSEMPELPAVTPTMVEGKPKYTRAQEKIIMPLQKKVKAPMDALLEGFFSDLAKPGKRFESMVLGVTGPKQQEGELTRLLREGGLRGMYRSSQLLVDPDLVVEAAQRQSERVAEAASRGMANLFSNLLTAPIATIRKMRELDKRVEEVRHEASFAHRDAITYYQTAKAYYETTKVWNMVGGVGASLVYGMLIGQLVKKPAERLLTPVYRPVLSGLTSPTRMPLTPRMVRISPNMVQTLARGMARGTPGLFFAVLAGLGKFYQTFDEFEMQMADVQTHSPELHGAMVRELKTLTKTDAPALAAAVEEGRSKRAGSDRPGRPAPIRSRA